MGDFRLIAITKPENVLNEAGRIRELLESGFWRVHIRKPAWEADRVERLLMDIPEPLHHRLTLHDHPQLALKYGLGFQTNGRCGEAPEGISVHSHSCHSVAEAAAHRGCAYVTLSPVYDSISKPGYRGNSSILKELKAAPKDSLPLLIALGGVTPHRFLSLQAAGFGGAAMLGSIW